MKGRFWRKALAAALALLIVSGSTPIQPLSQVFEDIAITASAEGTNVDLAVLTGDYTAQDGDVLTGSTSGTVTIANNAKITLSDVTITGGIVCSGTAEITLVGTNSVSGATNMAGIQVGGSGTTLTIKGNGSLTANGGGNSAGIGLSRAWKVDATGGDIVIEGGNITATGKGMGAGIGTGVSFGDDANHTATIGNITIKGGTVTAIGGTNQYFPGSGIGKGGAYSYGNTVVGTVTITTNIDLVNASSISEIVTYKHGETDVTSIASDYFTINEDGDRRIIVPNDDAEYNVTIAEEITGGTVTADKTTAKAGELVALTVTPASGYVLQSLTVKDASDNDVSLSNKKFIMPKGGVTVSATFIQTTAAFDEATGVLTLNGNVVADEVKAYGAIIGDYGAIVKESPVTSVVCEPGTVLPADCSELFLNYTNLITIDLSNADISGVTNMSKMFGSQSLTTIYVNSTWSMKNVTSSDQMFYGCNLLRGGNGSRWEDVRVAVWESNGNDLEAAKAKASRSSYAIIDGKGGLPGYLTVKPKQTPSAPTANVITYTGEAQELVSAGDGTMTYSLDGKTYSEEIPKGTDAGTYTVYYKVKGSDNWNAVVPQTVEVTIAESYTITWKNGDETLEADKFVRVGTAPEYNGETPTKAATAQYTYTFSGWSDGTNTYAPNALPAVSGDVTYTAQFDSTVNKYTVTWKNGDTVLETDKNVEYGTNPEYNGETPIKDATAQYTYTFSGWSPTIDAVTGNVTYTAQFSETVNQYNVTLPENMEISNGITLTDGKADYGTEISFKVKDGYAASNVKANGTDLTAADGVYTVSVEGDTEITADIKKVYADGIGERLMGYSVSLEGDIGVNFYMELDDSVAAHGNTAYIRFTTPKGSDTETKTVLVKDAVQKQLDGKTYYVFKCNVSAKDMASEITAQMFDDDKAGTEYKYSVKDYADYLLEHTEGNAEYAKAAPLVKAMLNYGTYSQSYFGIVGTAANAGLAEADKVLDYETIPVKFKYNATNTTLPTGVTFEGATLSLRSETTLSLYFKGLADGTKFTCDGKTVETAKNGEYVVARIRGIKASELENNFTVTFEDDSETYNVTYNAMTYCYNVLNGDSDEAALEKVCCALYRYAEEASKYFGGNN